MNLVISRNSHEGQFDLFHPKIKILDGCLGFFTVFEQHLLKSSWDLILKIISVTNL